MELEFQHNSNHQERKTLFADIILPLPLPKLFTYRIPNEFNAFVGNGFRVVVQFGNRKVYTGIIAKLHEHPPQSYEAKSILDVLDDKPAITAKQLGFYKWLADYYLCNLGDVIQAGLPSGLKISSESRIQLNPHTDIASLDLNAYETLIINHLQEKDFLTYDDVSNITQKKGISKLIRSLLEKEAILLYEKIKDKYQPKTISKIRLLPEFLSEKAMEELFSVLEKKQKQLEVVLHYLQKIPALDNLQANEEGIEKNVLLNASISPSSLNTLIKNKVFEQFELVVSRIEEFDLPEQEIKLSTHQEEKENELLHHFETKNHVLLHGITGSGKTEIYISLIQKAIDNGTHVLLLLPEIALTTQIVSRLRKVFGNDMAVYHSRYSDNERVEVYKGVLENNYPLIVGVRSAVFLPFSNLGMVIIDEEHDSSYKQYDPAPRYNARDAALVLAKIHGAKVLLGSATPSTESYYHASSGKWGYVKLFERYGNATLPDILPVDIRYDHQGGSSFSKTLLQAIEDRLSKKEQVILFQNRRGYSPYIECNDCNEIVMCPNCNVSLTYHQFSNDMRCHYCGHHQGVPTNCEACGSTKINTKGFGTERIEEGLQLHFPEAAIQRMDLDTTRKKTAYQTIIDDFESGKVDILVGTQMVTKGLDFDNVSLVGVFEIDRMLYFPDYRSHERTYQMLTQVSGRAGRKEKKGLVIVQTSNTDHETIQAVIKGEKENFYTKEINDREEFNYPPFSRLIRITIRHEDKLKSMDSATYLAQQLRRKLQHRILGPEEPGINRIRNLFLTDILIKLERGSLDLAKAKAFILEEVNKIKTHKIHRKSMYTIDVDPV